MLPDRPTKIVLRRSVESAQYAAHAYRRLLAGHGMRCSMSRKADCWDNAPMESFFGSMKTELDDASGYQTRQAARSVLLRIAKHFLGKGWHIVVPMQRMTSGTIDGLAGRGRPQARRLRRPAPRLWGLTSATHRQMGTDAVVAKSDSLSRSDVLIVSNVFRWARCRLSRLMFPVRP